MKKAICELVNKNYLHRGYFDNEKIPENSIEAFKLALNLNYNIELDVQLTKDNKIVVFHDFSLKRMCGVNKLLCDCTYEELKKYNLLNTKYKIPLFIDVLRLINGKVNLLVETKVEKYNSKLETELSKILNNYNGIFAIQSFNYLSIKWFKKNKKEYVIGILLSKIKLKNKIINILLRPDFVSCNIKYLPNKYIKKKRKKIYVFGWTFRTLEELNKKKIYCDRLIIEKNILKKL